MALPDFKQTSDPASPARIPDKVKISTVVPKTGTPRLCIAPRAGIMHEKTHENKNPHVIMNSEKTYIGRLIISPSMSISLGSSMLAGSSMMIMI